MNNARRKKIGEIIDRAAVLESLMEELKTMVEEVKDEESDSLENMPENLQRSERYQQIEEAVGNLESAYDMFDDFDVADFTSYLEEAQK